MIEDVDPVVCPACGSERVRKAKLRRPQDWLRLTLGQRVHRCRECRSRFYEGLGVNSAAPRRERSLQSRFTRWRRRHGSRSVTWLALAAAVLVLVLLFFQMITAIPAAA